MTSFIPSIYLKFFKFSVKSGNFFVMAVEAMSESGIFKEWLLA